MSRARRTISREESSATLDDDQVGEFKATFDLLSGNKKEMTKDDLRTILKQFNMKISGTALDKMFAEADITKTGGVPFSEFMSMMSSKMRKTDSEAQVMAAFEVFDQDKTGVIEEAIVSNTLLNYGDKLTENELNEMLNVCLHKDNTVHYKDFVGEMFGARKNLGKK
mmetsp:Transcript_10937/g.12011  ORF Transcript_10937/g.12011 Transcript_10937/m.12011 type:complete len:167 (+) Transcript_10937:22-522(+)